MDTVPSFTQVLSLDRFLTRSPFCLAKTASLQSLDHSQGLFCRASNVQIVNDLVAQDAFGIDHEQTTQRDAAIFNQHAVIAATSFW